jgi:hypothetical protein
VAAPVQVFAYPEELDAVEPAALVEQVLALGFDAVSVALAYHRARRVLPRQRRVSLSPGGAISFTPAAAGYERLVPGPTAPERLRRDVERLREACAEAGLRFHAWLVALHNEPLALRHPDAAALTLDGEPTGFSLCPSSDDAAAYVAALVEDVCAQLEPDAVDLEAALYPAWEPSYTLTLALEPLAEQTVVYGAQCFCGACRALPGLAALEERVRAAAAGAEDEELDRELAAIRGARVEDVLVRARGGCELVVTATGPAASARIRGLEGAARAADRVLLGLGPLAGEAMTARLAELRPLAGGKTVTTSLNWTPERDLAADAERAAAGGADGLALYNLSLVPERGLAAFAAAVGAFRAAAPA